MSQRLVIVDGNSLINRAYYAIQRPMMTKEGVYTHAIYGFLNMLNKILDDYSPDYIAVAWDLKAPTFRHKDYEGYKAGRKKMPMELAMQLPLMKDVLEAMHISNLSMEGYEADDIIGTVARLGEEQGMEPLIITGDKDALQLVTDSTKVLITKKGISEFDLYDESKMMERYELSPQQFIDLKGLMGDQSDNIPGIPGVGEKTGINLLKQFGSIEELLNRTDEITSPKLRDKVKDNAPLAVMSRKLAEIIRNVPIDVDITSFKYLEPDKQKLLELFTKLEFNSFIKKMNLGDEVGVKSSSNTQSSFVNPVKNKILIEEGNAAVSEYIDEESDLYIKIFSDNNHISSPVVEGIGFISGENYVFLKGEKASLTFIEYLKKKKPRLCGHGLSEDEYVLLMNGCFEFETAFDSEIAAYVIDPSKTGYPLKVLAAEYFQMDIDESKDIYELSCDILTIVYNLRKAQEEIIHRENLDDIFGEVELPLVKVLASMEKEGFRVEGKELSDFGDKLAEEVDDISSQIYSIANTEFNINSPKQLGEILFEKMELPHGKKTKTGYSTSAEVLDKIKDEHEIIPLILRYRFLTKLRSTYVEGMLPLIGEDKKIRAHFQQTVTATGRISCTEPNLQNIPIRNEYGRLIRKAFVPETSECVLVGADYSQIELRVLAHLSGDEGLIEAFNNGDDIHRATASRVFGIPYDDVTSTDRSKAKAVNFGVIYGMSGFGLSEELGITRKEAEAFIKDYFNKHPKVKAYMDEQISSCKERGYTETLYGRRRYIPEVKSSNFMVRSLGERLAMNSPIQGTAADIIKKAMILVYKELTEKNYKSKLILQVHDELIINTYNDEKEKVEELLLRNMSMAAKLTVELVSDLNSGATWYDLK